MEYVEANEITGLWTYLKSLDWTEPWILALVVFHAILIVTTLTTRNHGSLQAFLFSLLLLSVFFSENINALAAKYWFYFSRQQYFDSQGMFISIVFSIPLLVNCLIMVCNWLYVSGTVMVKLKQAQLRERIRHSQNTEVSKKNA